MIRIELKSENNHYRPGEVLEGEAVWEFPSTPQNIAVSLEWETEGKGDPDGEVCIEQAWAPQSSAGREPFRWTLPAGPVSLDGQLIKIRWILRIWSINPSFEAQMKITISHLTTPVLNRQVESLSIPVAFVATSGATGSIKRKS